MKLLVVLAVVAFAGCQASVLRSDEPKLHFDVVKDTLWNYFAKATQTAQETLKTIRESELGEQVNTKIQNSFKAVGQYATIVQDQASTIGKESYNKISEKVDWMSERLQSQIYEVKEWLKPYSENLRAQMEQQIEQLSQEVASYTKRWRTQPLKLTVTQMIEQIESGLMWSFLQLDNLLGPTTWELRDKIMQILVEFDKSVTPAASSVLRDLSHRARKLELTVLPYIHDLEKKLDPYTQDIKSQLSALWNSFS